MLCTFGETKLPLCSFWHLYDEAIKHIFLECICVNHLWNHVRSFPTNGISRPILTPQIAMFGFINGIESNVYKIKINFIFSDESIRKIKHLKRHLKV